MSHDPASEPRGLRGVSRGPPGAEAQGSRGSPAEMDLQSSRDRPRAGRAVPEGLWELLARLDRCCDITVDAIFIDGVRHWEMTVRRRGTGPTIRVQRRTVGETVTEAVAEAEARGWPG